MLWMLVHSTMSASFGFHADEAFVLRSTRQKMKLLERRVANGEAAMQSNDFAAAVEEFEAALKIDPEHPVHRNKYLMQMCTAHLKVRHHKPFSLLSSHNQFVSLQSIDVQPLFGGQYRLVKVKLL
jgi:hypothetical protein